MGSKGRHAFLGGLRVIFEDSGSFQRLSGAFGGLQGPQAALKGASCVI